MCPSHVVRFYGECEYALESIVSKQIAFIRNSELNDPFDPYFIFETDFDDDYDKLTEFVRRTRPDKYNEFVDRLTKARWTSDIEAIRVQMAEKLKRCYIFSTVDNNREFDTQKKLYMWGHYGGGHRGVAIEFDVLKLNESISLFNRNNNQSIVPHPVIYTKDPPKITCENIYYHVMGCHVCDKLNWTMLGHPYTKSIDWSIEEEFRLLYWNDSDELKVQRVDLVDDTLTEVYIGYRTDKSYEQKIKVGVNRNFPNAKVFKCNIKKGKFALEFKELI